MSAAPAPAIELENLSVRFADRPLVDRMSLRVEPGERVSLTGPSGSGKTTILRCILGFVSPASGSIRIDGQSLTAQSVWELRRRLAYVGQEPELGRGRVRDALEQPFTFRANSRLRTNLERAPELMSRFLLAPKLLDEKIDTLSGGEKQRMAIITAILLERRIFLLDEAASALDRDSRMAVLEFFRDDEVLTVLSVAHDPEDFAIASRSVALSASPIGMTPGATHRRND